MELAEALLAVSLVRRMEITRLGVSGVKEAVAGEKGGRITAENFWMLCKSGCTMARPMERETEMVGRKKRRVRTERGRERDEREDKKDLSRPAGGQKRAAGPAK